MAEAIDNNRKAREEVLKQIIRELHAGTPVEELQNRFKKLIESTSPDEIAEMENALIREGFPPEEIQRLCDVHARVFEKSLRKSGKGGKIPGHPVHTFLEENKEAKSEGTSQEQESKSLPLAEIEKLIKKKALLDKESAELEREREALSKERKQLKTQAEGAAFRKKAENFNQRVAEYEIRRKAFDEEIKAYNESVKK